MLAILMIFPSRRLTIDDREREREEREKVQIATPLEGGFNRPPLSIHTFELMQNKAKNLAPMSR